MKLKFDKTSEGIILHLTDFTGKIIDSTKIADFEYKFCISRINIGRSASAIFNSIISTRNSILN